MIIFLQHTYGNSSASALKNISPFQSQVIHYENFGRTPPVHAYNLYTAILYVSCIRACVIYRYVLIICVIRARAVSGILIRRASCYIFATC